MDKGKGKLVEEEESDQEFNPEEPEQVEQESEEEESEEEYESEEEDKDELQDLIQEAQEYGDGGDMVDGLRSGKYRHKAGSTSLPNVTTGSSLGTSGKRSAEESLENSKKNKCP